MSHRHLFFDLDRTLWDFEKNSQEALHEMFHQDDMNIKCGVDFETFHFEYKKINEIIKFPACLIPKSISGTPKVSSNVTKSRRLRTID